jgi:hypothetical protein
MPLISPSHLKSWQKLPLQNTVNDKPTFLQDKKERNRHLYHFSRHVAKQRSF